MEGELPCGGSAPVDALEWRNRAMKLAGSGGECSGESSMEEEFSSCGGGGDGGDGYRIKDLEFHGIHKHGRKYRALAGGYFFSEGEAVVSAGSFLAQPELEVESSTADSAGVPHRRVLATKARSKARRSGCDFDELHCAVLLDGTQSSGTQLSGSQVKYGRPGKLVGGDTKSGTRGVVMPMPLSRRKDQRRKDRKDRHAKEKRWVAGTIRRRDETEKDGVAEGKLRQVVGACHVESYNLKKAYDALLQKKHRVYFLDKEHTVLCFEVPEYLLSSPDSRLTIHRARSVDAVPPTLQQDEGEMPKEAGDTVWCFVFERSGVIVVWGPAVEPIVATADSSPTAAPSAPATATSNYMSGIVFFLSQFADGYLRPDWVAEDSMLYCYKSEMADADLAPSCRIKLDCLYLKTFSLTEKLAASFAVAQSMRLDVFENAVISSIKRVEQIPLAMANREKLVDVQDGYNSAKNVELRKQIAQLYCRMIDVNIYHDFLDVPEYFWDDDSWQYFWKRVHAYLEIEARTAVLNKRYSCLQELLEVVNEVRREAQEVRLMLVIIWLLVMQCLCKFLRIFLDGRNAPS